MKNLYFKIFAVIALALSISPLAITQVQAAAYQSKTINGCVVEYFILDAQEKRVAPNASLDRTKTYTVRLSVDIFKSKPECFTSDTFATGYLVTEDATEADKKDYPTAVKNGKVTAKYADNCFTGAQFKYGDKVTKYADIEVNGNNDDKQVWRYFYINTDTTCATSGTRFVRDFASNAVYVQAPWTGTAADPTCKYTGDAVTKDQVLKLPDGIKKKTTTEAKFIDTIKKSGVNFETTTAVEAELKKAGVSAAVIQAAKANFKDKVCPGSSGGGIDTTVGTTFTDLDQDMGHFENLLDAGSIPELITRLIRILFVLIGLVAVIVIIIAGFQMVISSGNEATLKKAKDAITWAIIGLVVSLMAFSIVSIVQRIIQS